MKNIKNKGDQGFYLAFETPEGPCQRFIGPKATIEVPSSWGGSVVDNLLRKRMITVKVTKPTPEPKVDIQPEPQAPVIRNQKWFDEQKRLRQ